MPPALIIAIIQAHAHIKVFKIKLIRRANKRAEGKQLLAQIPFETARRDPGWLSQRKQAAIFAAAIVLVNIDHVYAFA